MGKKKKTDSSKLLKTLTFWDYVRRCGGHAARQLTGGDYAEYDLLIGMDQANLRNMRRICGGDPEGKLHRFCPVLVS